MSLLEYLFTLRLFTALSLDTRLPWPNSFMLEMFGTLSRKFDKK